MAYDETFQKIVDNTDIVEVVSEFVTLEKAGANYRGLCPFHNEKTPSFYVSPEKKIATCFGCHKTWDSIAFVADVKKIPFIEAAKYCADKSGLKVNIKSQKSSEKDYSKYYKIMDIAQEFYTKNLNETKSGLEAIDYLLKRGISSDDIKQFGIGLSSDKPDVIYQILKSANILEIDMVDSGLVKNTDSKYYDLFRGRIMFPIKDVQGHIIGYSARVYKDIDKLQPKYVNSNENVIFKKRNALFNIYEAIPHANKAHRFILCEGQMDVIAISRAGFREAVCSMGTGLTKEQCMLMKKYVPQVLLMYDNDSAGVEASLKAINLIKSVGLNVSVVKLKDAKDADEYALKYGIDKLNKYITDNELSEIEFNYLASTFGKDLANANDFENAKQEVFSFLAKINEATISERYLNKLSKESNTSFDALLQDYNTYLRRNNYNKIVYTPKPIKPFKSNVKIDSKYEICVRRIIGYATISKQNALTIEASIDPYAFDDVHFRLWAELINTYYMFEDEFDRDKFLQIINGMQDITEVFVDDINKLALDNISKFNNEDLLECIEIVNELGIVKKIDDLKKQIKSCNDDTKLISLLSEFSMLKSKIEQKNKKG